MKITSIKDPIIMEARSLNDLDVRKKIKKILIYGSDQLSWAINYGIIIERVFFNDKKKILDLELDCDVIEVSEGILKKISNTNYLVPIMAND